MSKNKKLTSLEKKLLKEMDNNLIIEQWKQIKIQNNLVDYEVSNTGKVRRMKTGLIFISRRTWAA